MLPLRTRKILIAVMVCSILGAACSPFAPRPRAVPEEDLPQTYSLYTGESEPERRWWHSFADPELNRLVETAMADGLSIQEAWARLNQARAVAVQAGAARYPDLTAEGSALVGRQKSSAAAESRQLEQTGIGLASRYEIDLWGRVAAGREAALLGAAAAREDLNTAAVTLSAEVASRWIGIISQRMQKDLIEEQLKINRTLFELVKLRFKTAMVSALDVYQQKQVVENLETELPLVEEREALLNHQLAVLLGKPPRTELAVRRQSLPDPAPLPPAGLPADLLSARPDVRSAGLRLEAADWQVAEARANRLPALSLAANARYGEGDLDVIFDRWLLSLAANLTAPIFDGGRRAAEVERSVSVADERLAVYRRTVLTAVKEVEDALVSEARQKEHIEGIARVIATARQALEEAGNRYRNGLNDYLPVLTQLLSVQRLERELVQRKADLLATRIQLHRALGGTWAEEMTPPPMTGNRVRPPVKDTGS
ncbi:MAG: efflux transporter outer membrane subunit [Desulfobacterales bacterium]|nr:efflux transporter outer membrane subunit [Desulfobacterales bacterium]